MAKKQTKRSAAKYTPVGITLRPSLVRRVDRYAKAEGISRSAAISQLCEMALDEGEHVLKAMLDERVMSALLEAFRKPGVLQALAKSIAGEVDERKVQPLLDWMMEQSPKRIQETVIGGRPVPSLEELRPEEEGGQ